MAKKKAKKKAASKKKPALKPDVNQLAYRTLKQITQ